MYRQNISVKTDYHTNQINNIKMIKKKTQLNIDT